MSTSKSSQPSLIFCEELGADEVRARLLRLARLVADGDDEHAHGLTGSRGQHDGSAHDLIGVARIDAEANGDLDRLVELGERRLLHDLERLLRPDTPCR